MTAAAFGVSVWIRRDLSLPGVREDFREAPLGPLFLLTMAVWIRSAPGAS